MSMRELGTGLLGGLLLGAYVGWAFGPDRKPVSLTATARASTGVRATRPPCPAVAPPGTSAEDAAVIEAQDYQIRELSDLAFGRPLVWPDPETPSAIEASLEEAVASCAHGVTLLESDCAEPPCLAAMALEHKGDRVSDLCPDLPNLGSIGPGNYTCPDGSRPIVQVIQLDSGDYRKGNEDRRTGNNPSRRFQLRSRELLDAVVCP